MYNKTQFDKTRYEKSAIVGKIGEIKYKQLLVEVFNLIVIGTPNTKAFPYFDFISFNPENRKMITHEVKTDRTKSENVGVQIWSSSKHPSRCTLPGWEHSCNSGLYSTYADYYTIYQPYMDTFYIAKTEKLISYIEQNPGLKKRVANRDKTEQTGIVLIPKRDWEQFGEVVVCDL